MRNEKEAIPVIDARAKSLFIYPAAAATILLLLIAAVQTVIDAEERTAWLGAAIACLPLPLVMARLFPGRVVRTSENLPLMLLLASAGLMVAAMQQFVERISGWGPTSVALAACALLLLYVFWYSRFGRHASARLAVGGKLPEFELTDTGGEVFRTGELAGSPAVLLFYRGNWCPLCMAQVREIAARYQDLDALGIKVVLVSPQPDDYSRSLAAQLQVPFRFLVDEDNRIANMLDIGVRNGVPLGTRGGYAPDTVMPTVIVCNANGTIVFSDQTDNYRVRPEPDVFLAILRRSGAIAA